MRYKKINLPDWTKGMPDHALMTASDVLPFFGYKVGRSVSNHIKRGFIPEPDKHSHHSLQSSRNNGKFYWKLESLRALEKQQLNNQSGE